jgi:tetratricopeptide (TPR) repeat protein
VIPLLLATLLAAAPASPSSSSPAPAPAPPSTAAAAQAQLEAANALYLAGDLDGAIRAYRAILDAGWEGSALDLNLGNALARAGARGQAMASWLRALRLDPADADARANLELARAQDADQLVGAAEPPLHERLAERTGDLTAVLLFGAAWAAFWALLWLRSRATRSRRGLLATGATLAALLSLLSGALLAWKADDRRTPTAVVVAATAPVREGPARTLKPGFELHEGTVVRVLEARGDLARVRLANRLEGWVASADLEVL